jgi:hypothetical protein
MTRSNTLAVTKAKCGDRDRRNRAIVKRLAAGATPRAVGAEFGRGGIDADKGVL